MDDDICPEDQENLIFLGAIVFIIIVIIIIFIFYLLLHYSLNISLYSEDVFTAGIGLVIFIFVLLWLIGYLYTIIDTGLGSCNNEENILEDTVHLSLLVPLFLISFVIFIILYRLLSCE